MRSRNSSLSGALLARRLGFIFRAALLTAAGGSRRAAVSLSGDLLAVAFSVVFLVFLLLSLSASRSCFYSRPEFGSDCPCDGARSDGQQPGFPKAGRNRLLAGVATALGPRSGDGQRATEPGGPTLHAGRNSGTLIPLGGAPLQPSRMATKALFFLSFFSPQGQNATEFDGRGFMCRPPG